MKLNIVKLFPNIDINACSSVEHEYVSLSYDMNSSIIEAINNFTANLDEEFLIEYNDISDDNSMEIEEKTYYLNKIDNLRKCLFEDINSFLNCFDSIEIDVNDVDDFNKIDKLIEGINIPVIINVREISDSYLIDNIKSIDDNLKEKFDNKITYCIKQCMYDGDSHYEDNSYDIDDVIMVLNFLDNVVKDVEKYNFTPFEKIMYIYDVVKDRYFQYADEEESYLESRDLARVLKSKKIVCFGFAILFKSILDKLDIENEIVYLNSMTDEKVGHVRNLICVKDSKYELDHILYFDATWDSKKENICDTELLDVDRYDHFAKSKIYFMCKDWGKLKENYYLPYFLRKDNDYSFLADDTSRKLRNIKKMFEKIDWLKYCNDYNVGQSLVYKMSCLLSDDPRIWISVIRDYDFCVEAYKECCKMLKREVSIEAFSRCLYTVRRVQNSLNPNKYNNDINHLVDIISRYMIDKNTGLFRMFFEEKIIRDLEKYAEIDLIESRQQLLTNLGSLTDVINEYDIDSNTSVKDVIKILKK